MNYTELVDEIHEYTNRDSKVLPYARVKKFINFASNNCYTELRVPPLESVITYNPQTEATRYLPIPDDTIEFIQLRKLDSSGDFDKIYNMRSDIRSFHDDYMSKGADYYYSRQGNNLVINPKMAVGDVMELFFYTRLPSMDARYAVNADNYITDLLYYATTTEDLQALVVADDPNAFINDPDLLGEITQVTSVFEMDDGFYLGRLAENWLRDQEEKTILYGALIEAFSFLNDDSKLAKYKALYDDSILKLNKEAALRAVRGGVSQSHYSSSLL